MPMSRPLAASRVAALLWIAVLTAPATAQQPAVPEGPIAFIGHGAMFDRDGREITPTPEFVAEALAFYREALLAVADDGARRDFTALEAEVAAAVAPAALAEASPPAWSPIRCCSTGWWTPWLRPTAGGSAAKSTC
jgi:hypothetical protein